MRRTPGSAGSKYDSGSSLSIGFGRITWLSNNEVSATWILRATEAVRMKRVGGLPIFPFIVVVLVAVMNPARPPKCQQPIQVKRKGEGVGGLPFEVVFVRGLFWVLCIVLRHGGGVRRLRRWWNEEMVLVAVARASLTPSLMHGAPKSRALCPHLFSKLNPPPTLLHAQKAIPHHHPYSTLAFAHNRTHLTAQHGSGWPKQTERK